MNVSSVCQSFVAHATAMRWNDAVVTLNGQTMYEMLRALKALDTSDTAAFKSALAGIRPTVNGPRIDYALAVVQTRRLPAAPPGLPKDQVTDAKDWADARNWINRPHSILQEPIPKRLLPVFNAGLTAVDNALMQQLFGAPRSDYSDQDQPITNAALRRRMLTSKLGPFAATGLDSAIASLQTVMTSIQSTQRLVYRVLGTEGMLSVRYVRGSKTHISNHSWGTAIDLKMDGLLDKRGDDEVQFGLLLIIFNARGWYWGAGFPTEDGMHFEAGQALIKGWKGAL